MRISEFQKLIEDTYGKKDRSRGLERTWLWFSEEVGELARALNGRTDQTNLEHEFADVLAWLTTLASIKGLDLDKVATARYGKGCPRCNQGYSGRFAILETLPMTDDVKRKIIEGGSAQDIKRVALANGMMTLRRCDLRAAARGRTSLEAVISTTLQDVEGVTG